MEKHRKINSVIYCKTAHAANPNFLLSGFYLFFLLFRISSSPPVILLYLKKKYEATYTVCDPCFTSHLGVMFQQFCSIWSSSAVCTQMRITEQLKGYDWIFRWGQVQCHLTDVCLHNHNSKEDLGMRLKQSPMYNFLLVPAT